MPQIFKYLKFIFSFLSNEHLPPHVHVSDEDDNRNVFDLIIIDGILADIKVRHKAGYKPMSEKDQGVVKAFIYAYYAQIVTKWFEYFVLQKSVKSETIRKLENLTVDTQKFLGEMQNLNERFYPKSRKQAKRGKK
ncbi:MAG: DUF4160 domain-containing protein [Chitinispirillales bacterium]|jgi:hypothetical protein|nr:DUF4160 domain-containing protein [Chitinispirillales bacterium]